MLVLDNKEQANLKQDLIDFLLFLSTGAQRGRSRTDGSLRTTPTTRPVGVVTSIEGMFREELQNRCVEVEYKVTGDKMRRGPTEREIGERRHEIGSALVQVFKRYLEIAAEERATVNPIPGFEEHFVALCHHLRAYGDMAGKPSDWAESMIKKWDEILSQREPDENELEHALLRVMEEVGQPHSSLGQGDFGSGLVVTYEGKTGTLFWTDATTLLTWLQRLKIQDLKLPKSPNGLSRRLRSGTFRSFVVLDHESAPKIEQVKRTKSRRPIGLFRPDDDK